MSPKEKRLKEIEEGKPEMKAIQENYHSVISSVPIIEYVYETPKWAYRVANLLKLIPLSIGIFLTLLIYNTCMFSDECNSMVTGFLILLALVSFQAAGWPIDKLVKFNIKN